MSTVPTTVVVQFAARPKLAPAASKDRLESATKQDYGTGWLRLARETKRSSRCSLLDAPGPVVRVEEAMRSPRPSRSTMSNR
ncbi:hypothetical protein EKK58_05775 [Candidatus Dependentiae bacterium]|nr:MAG: hypothetical protein EKK58_05775 [Candidatus Dependentiae bacterium]